ncbi:MAG: S-layer homology domain-containing protein [Oscillospiraceae bacterium]
MKRKVFATLFTLMLIFVTTVSASALNVAGIEGPDIPAHPVESDFDVSTIEAVNEAIENAQEQLKLAETAYDFWQSKFTDEDGWHSEFAGVYGDARDSVDAWEEWIEKLNEKKAELMADLCTCVNNEYGCSVGTVDDNCPVCVQNVEYCRGPKPVYSGEFWQFYYDQDSKKGTLRIFKDSNIDNANIYSWPWNSLYNRYYVGAAGAQMRNVVTNIVVEDNVTSVGEYMFYEMPNVQNVHFGLGITNWGRSIFGENAEIDTVTVTSRYFNVVALWWQYDYNNYTIQNLVLDNPEMVVFKEQSDGPFKTYVERLIINNVKTIGNSTFEDCTKLTEIVIEENSGLESIGETAFRNCSNLTGGIIIPDCCTYVGGLAFDGCTNITNISVPETTQLGYSDIFQNDEVLNIRMEGILDGKFSLGEVSQDEELTVPDGWYDSHLGEKNTTEYNGTQVTKAGRWKSGTDNTVAEVELQFSYSKTPGMDFVFVLDYSESMASIGNEAEDMDSKFANMQSKVLDVAEELLTKEGYDNRIALISFGTGLVNSTDGFITKTSGVDNFVKSETPQGQTNYSVALKGAADIIKDRTDASREAVVIFISDGIPNTLFDGKRGTVEQITEELTLYGQELREIQQNGELTKVFGVLQNVSGTDAEAYMQLVCTDGLFFTAQDTEEFSDAVNKAIGAALGRYVITDVVNADFTLNESTLQASYGEVNYDESTRTITWDLTGALPYNKYTLSFEQSLNKVNGEYSAGLFDTNDGDAIVREAGETVNSVETPVLPRDLDKAEVVITPADITIYMGADGGYESVIPGEGGNAQQSNGLPEPGYYITLPDWVNAKLQGDKDTSGAVDLSTILTFKYDVGEEHRVWNLERYHKEGDSEAYNKYVYRLVPVADQVNVRLEFTGEDGNITTSDTFNPAPGTLHQEYTMTIYPGALQQELVKASITIDGKTYKFDVKVEPGVLTIRGVTGEEDTVSLNGGVSTESGFAASVPEDTTYTINGSDIGLNDQSGVQLLVDELVQHEDDDITRQIFDAMTDRALEAISAELGNVNTDFAYMNLVDTNNGNVYVTANKPVTVTWPYPAGTDSNDTFYIVHFTNMNRGIDLTEGAIASATVESLETENTENGIRFTVKSFSPFVLVWSDEGGGWNPPDIDDDKPEKPGGLNTEDHVAYIIGYPDGEVKPEGNITRAEVATIFFRLLTDETRDEYWSKTNSYTDVPADSWFNNAISTLSNMGIIDGYADGSFRPDAPITRAEFTKIAVSFFEYADYVYENTFTDVRSGSWYTQFIAAAVEIGLIEGYPDGTFRPDNYITRAEACTIVNRTLNRAPDEDHLLPESVMITWPDNQPGTWYYADMQEATNSHDYDWLGSIEDWTEKLEERDWEALEKLWSDSHDAPGGEVMG